MQNVPVNVTHLLETTVRELGGGGDGSSQGAMILPTTAGPLQLCVFNHEIHGRFLDPDRARWVLGANPNSGRFLLEPLGIELGDEERARASMRVLLERVALPEAAREAALVEARDAFVAEYMKKTTRRNWGGNTH